jgi:hypothetical protein
MRNATVQAVKSYIRNPYAFPGGYQLVLIMRDGELLCPDCAKAEFRQIVNSTKHNLRDGWAAGCVDIYWEGPAEYCAHCNTEIESVYGDPEQAN